MTSCLISHEKLRGFVQDVFVASGVDAVDAEKATDVLMWASLRGVDTHGVRNLKRYYIDSAGGVGRRDGVIRTGAPLTVERDSPTTAVTNANGGMGLSASVNAMTLAIDKATAQGIGVVTVRNSTHFGAAGCYAHMATERFRVHRLPVSQWAAESCHFVRWTAADAFDKSTGHGLPGQRRGCVCT